jgi:hypothetical protein
MALKNPEALPLTGLPVAEIEREEMGAPHLGLE